MIYESDIKQRYLDLLLAIYMIQVSLRLITLSLLIQKNGKVNIFCTLLIYFVVTHEILNKVNVKMLSSKIIELWFPIFGNPDMFLMDNGGEFGNDTMRELGNLFGINIKHTAGFGRWSNGVNERNHATVDLMLTQI